METVERFAPKAAINEIVPFGNQVVDRATGSHAADENTAVAKRNAAIHAAGALLAQFWFGQMEMELFPVVDALNRGAVQRQFAQIFLRILLDHPWFFGVLVVIGLAGPQPPPTRATFLELASKAAITASSPLSPACSALEISSSIRR